MKKIKIGDIVGRKSYGKDIIFRVKNIINTKKKSIAILTGVTKRVEADSEIEDLELIEKDRIRKTLKRLDEEIELKVEQAKNKSEEDNYQIGLLTQNKRSQEKLITGKILHLDGECSFIYTLQSCLNTEFKKI